MQRWKPSCRPTSCPVKPSVLMFCGCHDIWKDLTWFDSWKRLKNEKVWYGVVTLKMRRVLHDGWSNTWNREIKLCQLRLRSPSLSGCWVATRDPFMRCDEVSCLTLVCAALSTQIRKCSWCSLLRVVSKRWESPFARNSGSKDSNLLFCKTKRCPWFKGLGGLWDLDTVLGPNQSDQSIESFLEMVLVSKLFDHKCQDRPLRHLLRFEKEM